MNNMSKGMAVGVLTTVSLAFTGTVAVAAESPTLLAQVDAVDATTFSPDSTPLIVSTEDVETDDSAGCLVQFQHSGETIPDPEGPTPELINIGGEGALTLAEFESAENPSSESLVFSEFNRTYTWDADTWAASDGENITWNFYQDETCDFATTETWLDGLGAATTTVTFAIDAGEEPAVEAPGAPATVTVSEINANNAKVTWTAPSSGGDVESYVVLVGDDTVGTFADTVLTASLTGLDPDKDYTVTVKAVNDGGEASKAASFETKATTKDAEIELAAEEGDTLAGTKVTITATGLKPGEDYTIVLRSDPVTLASGTIASNGNLTQEVTLPADLTEGSHSITLTTEYWDGTALSQVIFFEVTADGALGEVTETAPELADTGLNLVLPIGIAALLTAAGLGFVVNGARKKATATV